MSTSNCARYSARRREQGSLFAVVAHEELAQAEARRLDGAHADQERVGARAARQTGGFGVEKGPLGGFGTGDGPGRKLRQKIGGQLGQIGDIHAAVAPVALPELLGFEVLAERRLHHLAANQLFDEPANRRRTGRGRRRSLALRIFAVDPRDAPAQERELLLDVLHASLFLCLI